MSTVTKDQKQAVRWMLDGLDVEARIPDQSWEKLEKTVANDSVLGALVRGAWGERWEFRLKPRTVKIGSREIEAPVLEPLADDVVWFVFADGSLGSGLAHQQQRVVDAGRAFNSREAAESFNLALRALLRGKA